MAIRVDLNRTYQNAEIEENTTLFRLTSPNFSLRPDLLNGLGANRGPGRYHIIQQPTSYVSDNVLLCMAEILYHMSRHALNALANNSPPSHWKNLAVTQKHLVIFDVHRIPDLVYIDTFAVALFLDHTPSIKNIKTDPPLEVRLTLIEEETHMPVSDPGFNPDSHKISFAKGWYEISPNDFLNYKHLLNPPLSTEKGCIDFVRQLYRNYPTDAVI